MFVYTHFFYIIEQTMVDCFSFNIFFIFPHVGKHVGMFATTFIINDSTLKTYGNDVKQ